MDDLVALFTSSGPISLSDLHSARQTSAFAKLHADLLAHDAECEDRILGTFQAGMAGQNGGRNVARR